MGHIYIYILESSGCPFGAALHSFMRTVSFDMLHDRTVHSFLSFLAKHQDV